MEDRLKKWTDDRLCKEGFTLLGLCIFNRGNLCQDKVIRVMSNRARYDKKGTYHLPFHRFSIGICNPTNAILPFVWYEYYNSFIR